MSFKDKVYAWRDGDIYQRIIKPTAEFSTALVNRIVNVIVEWFKKTK